ncbi:SDR family oxidoreductase [Salinithrix halophila]|uniref:SDR family oxidoreductase n=1 Tax=Salinithrix halophila TaxID=1485204 RepID=A0ABV8JHB4_9BACL
MKLKNKTAIVTGAGRGIGEAIAFAFAREGVDLFLVGRTRSDLERVAEVVEREGRRCKVFAADVSDEGEVKAAVQAAVDAFGKVDILVNNAGVGTFKSIRETSIEEWNRILGVNLTGAFLFTREVLASMTERGQGQIINISSDVGTRTIPRASAYCASKYGLEGFTGVLTKEVRKLGIKVGVIRPGMTDTFFNETKQGDPAKEGWLKAEDVAEAAVYMAAAPRHALVDEIMVHPVIQEY